MKAAAFWKAVTVDEANLLEEFVRLLDTHRFRYCVIGGQAVNVYVEPLVSLDLDVVIAADQLAAIDSILPVEYRRERFPYSLNLSKAGSDLRIQVQTDTRYAPFVTRAGLREVLGVRLPVAAVEDVLQGKVWAASDPERRVSKRQKDLADIARLLESFPVPLEARPRVNSREAHVGRPSLSAWSWCARSRIASRNCARSSRRSLRLSSQ